jgi:DNA repair protein RadC
MRYFTRILPNGQQFLTAAIENSPAYELLMEHADWKRITRNDARTLHSHGTDWVCADEGAGFAKSANAEVECYANPVGLSALTTLDVVAEEQAKDDEPADEAVEADPADETLATTEASTDALPTYDGPLVLTRRQAEIYDWITMRQFELGGPVPSSEMSQYVTRTARKLTNAGILNRVDLTTQRGTGFLLAKLVGEDNRKQPGLKTTKTGPPKVTPEMHAKVAKGLQDQFDGMSAEPAGPYGSHPYAVPVHRVQLVRDRNFDAVRLCTPDDAAGCAWSILSEMDREGFVVIALNAVNGIIGAHVAHTGTLTATVANPREVFKYAILSSAAAVIVVHNHPSGNDEPSHEDIRSARQMRKAGDALGIPLHDSLIVVGNDSAKGFGFTSLQERGVLA